MELQVRLVIAASVEEAGLKSELLSVGANNFHFTSDNLSIDDARQVAARISSHPFGSDFQSIVVFANKLSVEAQNALLKSFEEPLANTTLILIVPDESLLLPTLRSRFTSIENSQVSSGDSLGNEFAKLDYKDRLELITEKVKAKDQAWMASLVKSLSLYMHKNLSGNSEPVLQSLNLAAQNLKNRGSSAKMLLENIALTLPIHR